nr:class II glutamine amidotransferase [Gammaproteobacteria bacterium]
MCGIIGAASKRDISNVLLEGLRRLEYRGYDSAGMALLRSNNTLERVRTLGKVQVLADALLGIGLSGTTGIAHTRWATHGKPCEQNAHPHVSADEIAVVHNGIIENHDRLRTELCEAGYVFLSETDTEVTAHLIHYHYSNKINNNKNTNKSHLLAAVQAAASQIKGAFSLAVLHQSEPDELVAFRKGSPLLVGLGVDEQFVASDVLALRGFAQSMIYLEEGDSARITPFTVELFDENNEAVARET